MSTTWVCLLVLGTNLITFGLTAFFSSWIWSDPDGVLYGAGFTDGWDAHSAGVPLENLPPMLRAEVVGPRRVGPVRWSAYCS